MCILTVYWSVGTIKCIVRITGNCTVRRVEKITVKGKIKVWCELHGSLQLRVWFELFRGTVSGMMRIAIKVTVNGMVRNIFTFYGEKYSYCMVRITFIKWYMYGNVEKYCEGYSYRYGDNYN